MMDMRLGKLRLIKALPNSEGAQATPVKEVHFRLLPYFTGASLLAFAVVAIVMGYVFRTLSVEGMIAGHERQHINYARIIANQMWDADFDPLLKVAPTLSAAQLRAEPRLPALKHKVLRLLQSSDITKIKVYDLRGMTVFSTDSAQIGEDKSQNEGVIKALRGVSSSELVHENQLSPSEGEVQEHDVVESYVPRHDPATGRVSGVFEIYGDATTVLTDIGRRQWLVVATVIALLSLLFGVLWLIVKRAQGIIVERGRAHKRAQEALALSEERWKFALEGNGDGVWDRNLQTGEVVFSARYKEMYGFASAELENRHEDWDERVHPDDLALSLADRNAYFAGKKDAYANERRMQCKDGSWKWILSRGMVVARDADGKPLRMIGTHSDITERRLRDEAARLAETVFHTMDEAVTVTDANNRIVSVNPAFTAITGYSAAEVIGRNPKVLASGTHPVEFYREMWERLQSAGSWSGEIINRNRAGRLYVEWLSIKQVHDERGQPTHHVAVFSDISERKATEERMHHLAHFDVLTGLPNRALFSDRLHQAMAKARRDQKRLALMFVDLDRFKPVNDNLGHQVGDLLLKEVAARLSECLRRESDTVGRFGGDEFVVLLSEIDVARDVMVVADHVLEALAQPFFIVGHQIDISSSIGVAIFPDHGTDESLLIQSADTAMYRAKENGRNRVEVAEPVAGNH